ncbi:MAG: glycosyltransferase family A protein [Rhabdochlamydiaceae bacterium]|nr:glycosyltransferase family A protein [Candidatus Amphrikana amoebophyrae]
MTFLRSKCLPIGLVVVVLLLVGAGVKGLSKLQIKKDRNTYNHAIKVGNPKELKPFVILICSYNNAKYVEQNIKSALSQDYSNFRVIFIDDASTDENYTIAKQIIDKFDDQNRVTLIHNSSNQGAMANVYTAVNLCRDDEIIVKLDGDDTLYGTQVLSTLNQYYNHSDTWMTYGQSIDSDSGKLGISKPLSHFVLKARSIRNKAWSTSHLRTFYAGLFKKIKREDFTYEGKFLPMSEDVAQMCPMIEMSGLHAFYIDEPLYIYNKDNPISDDKVSAEKQEFFAQYVRGLEKYNFLKTPPWETCHNEEPSK